MVFFVILIDKFYYQHLMLPPCALKRLSFSFFFISAHQEICITELKSTWGIWISSVSMNSNSTISMVLYKLAYFLMRRKGFYSFAYRRHSWHNDSRWQHITWRYISYNHTNRGQSYTWSRNQGNSTDNVFRPILIDIQ